jgi:hypothetical protein
MPDPLAHTPVTRYSTRHSRPKSCPLAPPLQHHRPALLHPSCTRHSRGRRVRCSGSALAATESARVDLKEATVPALSRNQTCDTTRTCNSKRTHTTPCCNTIPIYATYPAMYPRCLCARRVSLDITPLLSFRPCRTDPPAPAGNHCMPHAPFASHFKLPYHHTTTTAAAPASTTGAAAAAATTTTTAGQRFRSWHEVEGMMACIECRPASSRPTSMSTSYSHSRSRLHAFSDCLLASRLCSKLVLVVGETEV